MPPFGRKLKLRKHIKCTACGKITDENIIMHHTSYYPEIKKPVHKSCHAKIHWGSDYQELAPDVRQTIRFYDSIAHILNADLGNRIPQFFDKVEKIEQYYKKHPKNIMVNN